MIDNTTFSLFSKPINVPVASDTSVSVTQLEALMKGDLEKVGSLSYEYLKLMTVEAEADLAKKKELPYVTFSSLFDSGNLRRLDSSYYHTGLFVLDIDKIDNATEVFEKSVDWEHTVFSFISPSKRGVKIVVKADLTETQIKDFGHSVVCSLMIELVEEVMGVSVDPLKDNTRACFITATKDVWVNSKAKPIPVNEEDLRKPIHDVDVEDRNHEPPENPITSRAMVMRLWKGTERRLGRFPKQARYSWLVSFVTECQKKGIDRDTLLSFMQSHVKKLPQMEGLSAYDTADYTQALVKKVYKKYSTEFGIHYEWFLSNSTRYQYPIDGMDIATSRIGDIAALASERFHEFMFDNNKFWKFNGRVFKPIDEDLDIDFIDMIQAITPSDRPSAKKELISTLKARMSRKPAAIKGMPKMLFNNGVLDTSSWKFTAYTEEELVMERFTFEFNYDYDSKANNTLWNDMVKRVMKPNDKLEKSDDSSDKERLLYDYLGYSLFGNGQAEQVLLFTGKGANGKSSLINTLIETFPSNIVESIAPKQFGDRFTGFNLVGKILNIVPDIDYSDLGNEASFKKIVSNESVPVEEKFKKPWTVKLHCSHIFASNGDLQFKNNDNALDRRFLTVLLEQVFYADERDFTLKDRLKEDDVKQTIINKSIEGWKRYVANGYKFVVPESSIEAQKERVRELDHTKSFFETALVYEEGSKCSLKEILASYDDWCMANSLMRSDRVQHHKMGSKLREFIQYDAPRDVRIIKPQGSIHVKNMKVEFNPDMTIATEMLEDGLKFVKGVTR